MGGEFRVSGCQGGFNIGALTLRIEYLNPRKTMFAKRKIRKSNARFQVNIVSYGILKTVGRPSKKTPSNRWRFERQVRSQRRRGESTRNYDAMASVSSESCRLVLDWA